MLHSYKYNDTECAMPYSDIYSDYMPNLAYDVGLNNHDFSGVCTVVIQIFDVDWFKLAVLNIYIFQTHYDSIKNSYYIADGLCFSMSNFIIIVLKSIGEPNGHCMYCRRSPSQKKLVAGLLLWWRQFSVSINSIAHFRFDIFTGQSLLKHIFVSYYQGILPSCTVNIVSYLPLLLSTSLGLGKQT